MLVLLERCGFRFSDAATHLTVEEQLYCLNLELLAISMKPPQEYRHVVGLRVYISSWADATAVCMWSTPSSSF